MLPREAIGKVIRPQKWFKSDTPDPENPEAEQIGTTAAHIYKPTNKEADIMLKTKPCLACRFFKYEEGQTQIQQNRLNEMLVYDLKWTSLVNEMDPRGLGACSAKGGLLTDRFATCDCWAPKNEQARGLWARAKEAISKWKNGDGDNDHQTIIRS